TLLLADSGQTLPSNAQPANDRSQAASGIRLGTSRAPAVRRLATIHRPRRLASSFVLASTCLRDAGATKSTRRAQLPSDCPGTRKALERRLSPVKRGMEKRFGVVSADGHSRLPHLP